MGSFRRSFLLRSAEHTAGFARAVGRHLKAGDVLLLEGSIGAGKTHFARALIQSRLATPEDVPSPTFTLVQVYETAECDIWHADLYRLTDPAELVELGLTDAFEDAICLVEWPDRLSDLAPEDALHLKLELTDTEGERKLSLFGPDSRWDAIATLEASA